MSWIDWFAMTSMRIYLRCIKIIMGWPMPLGWTLLILICIWFISSHTRKLIHPCLYATNFNIGRAAITLHNSYIDFTDCNSVSTVRCTLAARAILSAYYALTVTSLDITKLHPFVTVRSSTWDKEEDIFFRKDLLVPRCCCADSIMQVLDWDQWRGAGIYDLGWDQCIEARHKVSSVQTIR